MERRVALADGLGNVECGRLRRGVDALGLVAVGEGAAPFGALVAACAGEALALDLHAHVVDRVKIASMASGPFSISSSISR